MSVTEISDALQKVPAVKEIHDLHVWSICSGHIALSAHILLTENSDRKEVMCTLKECLLHDFGIEHTTIQFEEGNCGQGEIAK